MASDIVERLRLAAAHPYNQHGPQEFLTEAADEIESLRFQLNGVIKMRNEAESKVERLRRMLWEVNEQCPEHVPIDLLKQIRAALGEEKQNDFPQPLGGWAAGHYWHKECIRCGKEFEGDKRAWHCEPCSMTMITKEPRHDR